MTNNIILEPEEENSLCSNGSDSTVEFVIGDKIIDEEERLLIENEEIASKEESQFQEDRKENVESEEDSVRKREAEIKEKRYKRLVHLLRNSEMYAVILKNRMSTETSARKKESTNGGAQSSQESGLKKQRSLMEYNVGEVLTEEKIDENVGKHGKKNLRTEKIDENIGKVDGENLEPEKMDENARNGGEKNLGTEQIDENVGKGSEKATEVVEADFFEKTRVTNLGFTVSYKQPILLEGGTMRDYQLKGLEWMKNLFLNGVNGILADEMGLGKTIQVISFICYLIQQDVKGPFLIVAPLSTLSNWMSEFKRFAPKVPTLMYHGPEAERRELLLKILQTYKVGNKSAHRVVITSYQIPLKDKNLLKKINWYYLIIDEGHRIKNYNSLLSRTLREFNTIGRLLLTGTPLQNNLSELWSLLNFLLPEVFSSLDVFESWFDVRELEKNGARFIQEKLNIDIVNIMQEILIPFLLRREKKDVDLQLPPKKEILIYCPMTQRQKELYEATLDRSIEFLVKPKEDLDDKGPLPKRRCFLNSPYGQKSNGSVVQKAETRVKEDAERFSTKVTLTNPQMQLRKIVNHPYLVQFPLTTGTEDFRIDEDIVRQSGKVLVLDAMLAKLKSRGHKVVLFSYFNIMLDILEDYAIMRGYTYNRMDGNTKIADRNEQILQFVSDPNIFIFFVTIRAGGLGINLTAADTVIFFDSDWNPQLNLQSQDRCHRIGQTKPVVVYRLCTVGTIDERIIERGNAKRRLEKMILQKGKFTLNSKTAKQLDLRDLRELKKLLESTDHDTVINSNGFVLTDEQMEALLDRSDMYSDSPSSGDPDQKVFKVLKYEK